MASTTHYADGKSTELETDNTYLLEETQHPTAVFLPGESHEWLSLAGHSPWVTQSRTQLKQLSINTCISICPGTKDYQIIIPCTILDAWGWCTGTTQREGMGREEGGGFRMGNTCIPVADSFRYLAKPIQYCKV